MPHLVILYTPNLEAEIDGPRLCRRMADAMVALRDADGQPVFPVAGVRVLAFPARYFAVADGSDDHGFIYFNVRMARGRPAAVQAAVGQALTAVAREHLAALLASRGVGLTLQVDEGAEVFDAKFGNLHPLFAGRA